MTFGLPDPSPLYTKEETLLDIRDVHLSFGDRSVLKGVTGQVRNVVRPGMQQGQVIGLLGPSGVGKTQLFRILAGLQAPTAGAVHVTDKQVPVERGMMGLVAQNYVLYEHRTVLGNLVAARRRVGLSRAEARDKAMRLLARFGLESKADDYPAQLSGGQRQRVAIAQQLVADTHFLLMDEPFSGLDPIMVDKVCKLITEVSQMDELTTIIVSSHDLSAACLVADTLWTIGLDRDDQGKIVAGARIKGTYDLIERGLAWRPGIGTTRQFADFVTEIRHAFNDL